MSCSNEAWAAVAAQYNQDMTDLEAACLADEAAAAAIVDAQAALDDAIAAKETTAAAKLAAQQRAAQSQLATVAEAEKLGVECACPPVIPVEPEPASVLGG